MNFTIIWSYIILILVQVFALTFIPISLIGVILGRIKIGISTSLLIGGLLVWFGINLVWLHFTGYNLPLLAFFLIEAVKLFKGLGVNKVDPEMNEMILGIELKSIILIALYIFIFKEFNWF
ncbi:hypothetical protein [Flavobacterium sp.]|uniref:hypothetical protein n=1 Tax=Flavobacterium sp. TaxID=239 RepID=UPI0037535CFA